MTPISLFAELGLYLSLLVSTIYTLVFGYHWFSYGSSQKINGLALTVFLVGCAILLIVMFVSYRLIVS